MRNSGLQHTKGVMLLVWTHYAYRRDCLVGAVPEGEPAHASADVQTVAPNSSCGSAVDALFGMGVRQRTVTVSGTRAERTQDMRTYQVTCNLFVCSLPSATSEA
jgi:hypothetical protein